MKLRTFPVVLISVISVACIAFVNIVNNPLRRGEKVIESEILVATPIGTSMDSVVTYLKSHGLEFTISDNTGFLKQEKYPSVEIGEKSIRANLGHYMGAPYHTDVSVFWGFDGEGKLIEIWVWKTREGF